MERTEHSKPSPLFRFGHHPCHHFYPHHCHVQRHLRGLHYNMLYVAVSASHVTLSCDCGKISVVYSSVDHINAT